MQLSCKYQKLKNVNNYITTTFDAKLSKYAKIPQLGKKSRKSKSKNGSDNTHLVSGHINLHLKFIHIFKKNKLSTNDRIVTALPHYYSLGSIMFQLLIY